MRYKRLLSARGMRIAAALTLSCTVVYALGIGDAGAQGGGGTAKPPSVGTATPYIPATFPKVPPPKFTPTDLTTIHQFDVSGFIQDATVDATLCPTVPAAQAGGFVTVNGLTITVPCNSVVQMPANTLSWVDAVNSGTLATSLKALAYPSFEAHIYGNMVGDKHIAGVVYLSQSATMSGQGFVTSIDYSTGRLHVGSARGGKDQVALEINDPKGRFGRVNTQDPRFSVDDANPTIHAATGYPMCVPRTTTDPTVAGNTDDTLCPQANRPKPVNFHCRDFADAGLFPFPKSGNLSAPTASDVYCGHYVMPATAQVAAGTPDPRQQAPFEVGDSITYSGTLIKGGDALGDLVSAHTIEANVAIYTAPGTQPAYTAIGAFGLASADPNAVSIAGVPQEVQNRIHLEASTTDPSTPVDIYLVDRDPATGTETSRWVTPNAMTGETSGPNLSNGTSLGGGILTMMTGANPSRARLRATKAPLGLLTSPTRTLRVVQRSLCLPQLSQVTATAGVTYNTASVNGQVPQVNVSNCLASQPAANGLFAGQYTAPVFEFIFPETAQPGSPTVPNDLWDFGFLANGEGPGVGPLTPTPW